VKDYYGLVMNIGEFSSQITQPQAIMKQT
jgi:hypothetical protein